MNHPYREKKLRSSLPMDCARWPLLAAWFLTLLSCYNFNNPVDPKAENYQGFPNVRLDVDISYFVHPQGSDTEGDGSTSHPYRTISKAVSEADTGEGIAVAAGTYSDAVVVTAAVSLYGGFSAESWNYRNPHPNPGPEYHTILSNPAGHALVIDGTADVIGQDMIVEGFSIDGGDRGVIITAASPAIRYMDIRGDERGVEILNDSSPLIFRCDIEGGTAALSDKSYGIYSFNSVPILGLCEILGGSGNTSSTGMYIEGGYARVVNCGIFGGTSIASSEGVRVQDNDPFFANNVIIGGAGSSISTGIRIFQNSSPVIVNNTVDSGYGTNTAFGINMGDPCSGDIVNNIIVYDPNHGSATHILLNEESANSNPNTIMNNNFYGSPYHWDFDGSFSFSNISGMEADLAAESVQTGANVDVLPTFADWGNYNYALTNAAPPAITLGGYDLDFVGSFPRGNSNKPVDVEGRPRTVPWSIGPFERNQGTVVYEAPPEEDGKATALTSDSLDLWVGDMNTDTGIRGFLGFDITGLDLAEIEYAECRIYRFAVMGNPQDLGSEILVDHVDFRISGIDPAAYSLTPLTGGNGFTSFPMGGSNGYRSFEVTDRVRWNAENHSAPLRAEFRLRTSPETNNDGIQDQERFYSVEAGTNPPLLIVTYREK